MEKFTVGSVVMVQFPFSNLRGQKLRPALVLATAEFDNLVLCQITSKPYSSKTAVKLMSSEFAEGNLSITSYIRPDKIFTAEPSIIERVVGKITKKKTQDILSLIQKMFTKSLQ